MEFRLRHDPDTLQLLMRAAAWPFTARVAALAGFALDAGADELTVTARQDREDLPTCIEAYFPEPVDFDPEALFPLFHERPDQTPPAVGLAALAAGPWELVSTNDRSNAWTIAVRAAHVTGHQPIVTHETEEELPEDGPLTLVRWYAPVPAKHLGDKILQVGPTLPLDFYWNCEDPDDESHAEYPPGNLPLRCRTTAEAPPYRFGLYAERYVDHRRDAPNVFYRGEPYFTPLPDILDTENRIWRPRVDALEAHDLVRELRSPGSQAHANPCRRLREAALEFLQAQAEPMEIRVL